MNFTHKGSSGPQWEELSSVWLVFQADWSLPCLGTELAVCRAALILEGV